MFLLCCVTAHHKVSSSVEGQQEAHAAAAGNGEVITLPDLRRDPLPACQLGSAQRPGEYRLNQTKLAHCGVRALVPLIEHFGGRSEFWVVNII